MTSVFEAVVCTLTEAEGKEGGGGGREERKVRDMARQES